MPKYTIYDYNEEPVFYCKECLSLRVRGVEDQDYCDECGSTDIGITDINTWIKMYSERYGEDKIVKEYSIYKAD